MPELMMKSKAILGAVFLVFCSFAAADRWIGVSQHQSVDFSVKPLAASGHAAFDRIRVRNRKTLAAQGLHLFAIAPVSLFAFPLRSAGLAFPIALSSYDSPCEPSTSARAPPLS
jgi:hypothetical protein